MAFEPFILSLNTLVLLQCVLKRLVLLLKFIEFLGPVIDLHTLTFDLGAQHGNLILQVRHLIEGLVALSLNVL